MALLEMHRRGEIEPVIVRPAMILGPFHGRWELLNRMFALARRHLPLPIVGDGHKLKHCVHSRDVVELADRCLARPQAAGRVYNVAGRSAATLNEIAHAVIRAYRSRSFVVPVPRVLFQTANLLTTWLGDPLVAPEFAQHPWRHTCYETGRAQAELGWRAKYDTVQTVLAAALWYRGPGPDVRQSLLSDEE
jgi:nucleoside-diphosphate-sugar epimerase